MGIHLGGNEMLYIAIAIVTITLLPSIYFSIEKLERKERMKALRETIEQLERKEGKGERNET